MRRYDWSRLEERERYWKSRRGRAHWWLWRQAYGNGARGFVLTLLLQVALSVVLWINGRTAGWPGIVWAVNLALARRVPGKMS